MEIATLLRLSNLAWGEALGHQPSNDHQWVTQLLADLVDYAEKNELDEVAQALIDATDIISPILSAPDHGHEPYAASSSAEPQPEVGQEDWDNIVFLRPNAVEEKERELIGS